MQQLKYLHFHQANTFNYINLVKENLGYVLDYGYSSFFYIIDNYYLKCRIQLFVGWLNSSLKNWSTSTSNSKTKWKTLGVAYFVSSTLNNASHFSVVQNWSFANRFPRHANENKVSVW